MEALKLISFGCVFVLALLGFFTRTHTETKKRRRLTRWGWVQLSLTLLALIATAVAEWEENAQTDQQARDLKLQISDLNKENRDAALEAEEKLQRLLAELHAAKQEDSQHITQAKIRLLTSNLTESATDFASGLPRKIQELRNAKGDVAARELLIQKEQLNRELELGQRIHPLFSFALAYFDQKIKALAQASRVQLEAPQITLPLDVIHERTNWSYRIGSNAIWTAETRFLQGRPSLLFTFSRHGGKPSSKLQISTSANPQLDSYRIFYDPQIPVAARLKASDQGGSSPVRPLQNFEKELTIDLDRVLEDQLVNALEGGP